MRTPRLTALLVAVALAGASAQGRVFPGRGWERIPDVAKAGWAPAGLKAARDYSQTIPTAAVMIVAGGRIVDQWGETTTRFNIHLPGVTLPEGTYSARGAGGHSILVLPAYDTVIVHRVNTDRAGLQVTAEQFGALMKLILDSRLAGRSSSEG